MHELLPISMMALALLACTGGSDNDAERAPAQPPAAAADDEWVVRPEGFGPVRFGASLHALSSAIGEEVRPGYADFETCDHVRPKALPASSSLMIISDTVMRVEVDSTGVRTAEGAQVGDTEAHVLELYRGRISVEPHKYTGPEGHYLVVSSPDDTLHRIIFETDGQHVTRYRAGRRPAVEYVEGCA
jgi:hypothetical protein